MSASPVVPRSAAVPNGVVVVPKGALENLGKGYMWLSLGAFVPEVPRPGQAVGVLMAAWSLSTVAVAGLQGTERLQRWSMLLALAGRVKGSLGPVDGLVVGLVLGTAGVILGVAWEAAKDLEVKAVGMVGGGYGVAILDNVRWYLVGVLMDMLELMWGGN